MFNVITIKNKLETFLTQKFLKVLDVHNMYDIIPR